MTERTDDVHARATLRYPYAKPPAPGSTIEVAPGVRWLRMPLPYRLDHINVWLLDEADGCAVVDTGTRTDEATTVWRAVCAQSSEGRNPNRVTRVFVTHMHSDHVGMAGWLTRIFDCRLWMTRAEYFNCRVATSDTGREAPADALEFYRRAGWSDAAIDVYRARFGRFGQLIHPLPDSFRRVQDGEVVRIGAHHWRVIVGMGHSPEHACLYCPALKLFISGDQVLPRISSNVSVYPIEPDANPMAHWYDSLDKLQREVPDDVLVLPSHNECFYGLHARIERLREGQNKSFERLRVTLSEPRRAVDVFSTLFARPIGEDDLGQMSLATGESLACLNYLMSRGEVQRELRGDGFFWYSRCCSP
ncbi:MBL fold metallo-hydrolase [Paraburkholderia sp. HD33-4]|uniref:MBL fold metallo-hydrolase n=1 Tax=Paraburkholderia sp. HD33-4 TaxID=2883242 RepID=UPI001F23D7A5|nr:MBL fold metallo-hydrolase [Paraburkholderia sp. HD33-4]